MTIGMTSGRFDLIHYGRIHYLQRCRVLCDRLVVAVDSDEMVWAAKGPERVFGTGSGAELVIVPDVEDLESTTVIIKRVREKVS